MAEVFPRDAIILSVADAREHDLRVVFFSRESGLGDAIATGAKKSTSKQRMRLEPGTATHLIVARGRQFDRLTTSEPVFVPSAIRTSLQKMFALQFFLGLVRETSKVGDANPAFFDMAVKAITTLEEFREENVYAWCMAVALRVLESAGYTPRKGRDLQEEMEYFFEKPIKSWQLLSF